MTEFAISTDDFNAIIETQEESLEVEFKKTLDLANSEGKAKLAKEICALANYGGGWIIFGRTDNGSTVNELPEELININQDMINQISASYLSPAPHCTLRWVTDVSNDIDLPVLRVPSHGSEPICGAKNGPDVKGKITGIKKGTYYNRSAGPVSEAMTSPAEWKEVIRRCVLSEKSELLSALTVMITQPSPRQEDVESPLDLEFSFVVDEWLKQTTTIDEEPSPAKNFIVFGFELIGARDISIEKIKSTLQSMPSHHLGPHHFFTTSNYVEMAPHLVENAGIDGLQANKIRDEQGNYDDWPSFWRISESGAGVSVGIFWEDSAWIKNAIENKSSRTWQRGSNIWIASQIASIDTFMADIRHFAEKIGFDGLVRIKIVYNGLKDRKLNSARSIMSYSQKYVSKQDTRSIDLTFELDALERSVRSSAIATIAQQLNKPFQGPSINADTVLNALANYRSG
ncbi:MAG: ATP-binding protein [Pseudomonadota bacterium]|nr:ATP-binding protein [Pseudomonadota bacterium]